MKHRILSLVFITTIIFSVAVASLPSQTAHAQTQATPQETISYTSIDTIHLKTTIGVNNDKGQPVTFSFDNDFKNGNIWEHKNSYDLSQNGCNSSIKIPDFGSPSGQVHLELNDPYTGNCDGYDYNVSSIDKTEVGATMFNWTDPQNITSVIGGIKLGKGSNGHFTARTNQDLLNAGSNPHCDFDVTVMPDNKHANVYLKCVANLAGPINPSKEHHYNNVQIAGSPTAPITTPPPGPGGGTAAPKISCVSNVDIGFGPFSLNWLICPVVDAMEAMVTQLDDAIQNELIVDTNAYFNDQSTGAAATPYHLWLSLRNIAYALLVIVALVMVISQALGFEIFDAYTVRKVLPRIGIAIVAISLSWPISRLLVQFSNDSGIGIRSLIYGIAQVPNISVGAGTGILATLGVAIAAVALTVLGLLSFVGTAVLALLIGLFIVVMRRLIIVVCVVTGPLAFVAWILPGTQKLWKIWKDAFLGAVLVFPLITGTIAIGAVLASVENHAGGTNKSLINNIAVFVLYFGPYFAIPAIVKLASGAVGTLAGRLNDRSRGGFDRLKKYRQRKGAESFAHMKSGDRFQGRNAVTRAFNQTTAGLGTGVKGRFGLGAQGRSAADLQRRAAAAKAIQDNPLLQQAGFHDEGIAVLALSGGTRAGAERVSRQLQQANNWTEDQRRQAVATAAAVGFNDSNVAGAMQVMAQNKSRALAGDLAGDAGMDLVRQSAAQLSHGNRQVEENLMGGFAYHSRNAGRLDLGGEAAGESMDVGWQRSSVQQHAQGFGASTGAFMDHFAETIHNGDDNERRRAAIALSEMQAALPGATAENRGHITEALARVGVNHNLTRTVESTRQVVDPATGRLARDAAGNPVTESYEQTVNVTVEEQLANIASGYRPDGSDRPVGAPLVISSAEIQGQARQYGSAAPYAERGGAPPPPTTPPPGP